MTSTYLPLDDAARAMAQGLLARARIGALGVLDPATGGPVVSRVALGRIGPAPAILVSDLSAHARALAADPRCSVLIDGAPAKGDPLTHPRLTLTARANRLANKGAARAEWLAQHPKAGLYIDFTDFNFLILTVDSAFLNAGFGRATLMTAADLGLMSA